MYSFDLASFVWHNDFGFIHDVASITNSLCIIAQCHWVAWIYHDMFIPSLVARHLVCFEFGALIMNKLTIKIHTQVFIWISVLIYLGLIVWNRILGLYGVRNCQIVIERGCTILYSHHQSINVPVTPQPYHHFLSSVFLILTIPVAV